MFHRILLALDAGEAGSVAASFTVALARERGATVHVVHVDERLFGPRGVVPVPPPVRPGEVAGGAVAGGGGAGAAGGAGGAGGVAASGVAGGLAPADGVVAAALKDLHAAGVSATGVTYRTTRFSVPAVICDLAECVRADVIVLGSRRRRLPLRLRLSTRDRIARRTPLPVIAAPAPLMMRKHGRALPETAPLDISVRS